MRFGLNKGILTYLLAVVGVAVLSSSAFPAGFSTQYRYDELNRLHQVVYGDGSIIEYAYDNVGNRTVKRPPLPPQVTSLTATPATGSYPLPVTLTAVASATGGSIASYAFDFGDGSSIVSGSSPNASHSYTAAGSYTAKVTVTDNWGTTAFRTTPVSVTMSNLPPTVSSLVATPSSGVYPLVVVFTVAASDPDGSIASVQWDFNGDNTVDQTTTGLTISHAYTSPGIYTAKVRVVDNLGASSASSSVLITANAANHPPVVTNFTATPTDGDAPLTVNFQLTATDPEAAGNVRVDWNYTGALDGNGNYIVNKTETKASGSTFTASNLYSTAGTFTARAIVTDASGIVTVVPQTITVYATPHAPRTTLTGYPTTGTHPHLINFTAAAALAPGRTVTKVDWDFDGNGTTDSTTTGLTTTYTFNSPGSRTTRATVTDSTGQTSTATLYSVTYPANSQPSITSLTATPTSGYPPLPVTFTVAASDSDGTIDHVDWDFDGNGIFDAQTQGLSTTYIYKTPGTYTVKAQVVDNWSGKTHQTIKITVSSGNPTVTAFTATPSSGFAPLTTILQLAVTYGSGASLSKVDWDFDGNGTVDRTTTTLSTSYTYSGVGKFVPTAKIYDTKGRITTAVFASYVDGKPVVPIINAVTITPSTSGITPYPVTFTLNASPSAGSPSGTTIARAEWDFNGDNTVDQTTTALSVSHTYTSAGYYPGRVRVFDNNGIASAYSDIPIRTAAPNTPPTIQSVAVTFPAEKFAPVSPTGTVTAYAPGKTIVRYDWDQNGDGLVDFFTTSAGPVTLNYNAPGIYNLTVTAIDSDGLSSQFVQPVQVLAGPVIKASIAYVGSYSSSVREYHFVLTNVGSGTGTAVIATDMTAAVAAGTGTTTTVFPILNPPLGLRDIPAGTNALIKFFLNSSSTVTQVNLGVAGTMNNVDGVVGTFNKSVITNK